jgi:hypothetical protein
MKKMKQMSIVVLVTGVLLWQVTLKSTQAPSKIVKNQNPFEFLTIFQQTIKNKAKQVTEKIQETVTGAQAITKQQQATVRQTTAVRITNTSEVPTSFIIMALHSTDEETPLYVPGIGYVGQTIVSDPLPLQPHQSDILSLNDDGKTVIDSSRIFGAFVVAIQVRTEEDPEFGQFHKQDAAVQPAGPKIGPDGKVLTGVPKGGVQMYIKDRKTGKLTKSAILTKAQVDEASKHTVRLVQANKSYFSKFTKTWISDPKKRKLVLKPSNANNFSYPTDFVFDKEVREDFTRPNYDDVIKQLRAAEDQVGDKIFPVSYFDKNYLAQLPEEKVYEALTTAHNIITKPIVWKNPTLGTLLDTGKYKHVASLLIQFFIGIIVTIVSGGGAASMLSDLVQQAASSGSDLGAEISDLQKRGT